MTREKAKELHTGQVWVASKAQELGLIDGVLSFDEALSRLRSEVMDEQSLQTALDMAAEQEKKAADERKAREATEAKLKEAEAQLKESQQRLAAFRAKEREARFAADAKKFGAPVAFAEVLDQINAAVGDQVYGDLCIQLAAYAEQVEKGALFEEKGSSTTTSSGASALQQASSIARAKLSEGKVKSFHDGLAQAWAEHPELWQQYEKERGAA